LTVVKDAIANKPLREELINRINRRIYGLIKEEKLQRVSLELEHLTLNLSSLLPGGGSQLRAALRNLNAIKSGEATPAVLDPNGQLPVVDLTKPGEIHVGAGGGGGGSQGAGTNGMASTNAEATTALNGKAKPKVKSIIDIRFENNYIVHGGLCTVVDQSAQIIIFVNNEYKGGYFVEPKNLTELVHMALGYLAKFIVKRDLEDKVVPTAWKKHWDEVAKSLSAEKDSILHRILLEMAGDPKIQKVASSATEPELTGGNLN
jgi:hypothetical protein